MADEPVEEYPIDEKWTKFFSAVGYSVTRWSQVDAALFDFCHYTLNVSRKKTAIVFYRSKQIGDNMILTNKLMQLSLHKPWLKKWDDLMETMGELLPVRNHLAHDMPMQVLHVTIQVGKPEAEQPPPEQWWEIMTADTRMLHGGEPKRSKLKQIVSHIRAVEDLLDELRSFRKSLPKKRPMRRKVHRAPRSPRKEGQAKE